MTDLTMKLTDALAATVTREHGRTIVATTIHPGFDVFTIPHGGHLLALAGSAMLAASGAPDIFTITVHYLRRPAEGRLDFDVDVVGGSRRFTSLHARATQDGKPVMAVMASVGDRSGIEGPSWRRDEPWAPDDASLLPPVGAGVDDANPAFQRPNISQRFGLRPEVPSWAFARGELAGDATLRSLIEVEQPDQLAALIACDVTPPAVWNALGPEGWVPTIELTAHVRARPVPGPMRLVTTTNHVTDGFVEEDALVHDSSGQLIVQSRQLARWTGA